MLITWLDFIVILLETHFFCQIFFEILDVFFQGKTLYWTYLRNGWSDWCETKRRCIGWILGELCDLDLWPHTWPWPCNFNVKVWNSLIWRMGGLIDMEWKGCELIIHDHDCDLCLTLVGWVDVPYSDWSDLRRRRAVDISSFSCDDCENTCALCYCHHQIGCMNHLPLFRVRLWNKRCTGCLSTSVENDSS